MSGDSARLQRESDDLAAALLRASARLDTVARLAQAAARDARQGPITRRSCGSNLLLFPQAALE